NANSGHFVVNGVVQAPGLLHLTPAQLAQTTYQAGMGTSDDILVNAFDGLAWGAPAEFFISTTVNLRPAVTASNQVIANGACIAASSLFLASDPDGDAMMQYSLAFMSLNANSGHFVVNGVVQAPGLLHLTAAQLAQTTYQAGVGTSDDILVNAFEIGRASCREGVLVFSAAVNLRPVVTASNHAIANGASIAASLLFSASDVDGDALAQYVYEFKTVNANSGHFVVNGVVQAPGLIHLTPAQLAQTIYQAGVGTSDDILVNAF